MVDVSLAPLSAHALPLKKRKALKGPPPFVIPD
jgi:hypothetical protein